MRILVVTQYFWPESFLINDVVNALHCQGHHLTVATGKPNYPRGAIYPGYAKLRIEREKFAGNVNVIRLPLYPRGKAGSVRLFLNYLSFMGSALLLLPILLRGRKFDVVFFYGASPLTAALPAALIAKMKKAPLVLWIQDLWPESLAATGFLRNGWLLRLVGIYVRFIYARAEIILLQSKAFFEPVSAYADTAKLVYLPNPAPETTVTDMQLPSELDEMLSQKFSVVFAGNIGHAQSIETIVEAARHLSSEPRIQIVVAGGGSEATRLKRLISGSGLKNIHLTGMLDREMMPAVFDRASLLLVTLRDEPAFSHVVPSKLQAYFQAGKPVVGALGGEGARIIKAAGAGLVVAAEDGVGLARSILTFSRMSETKRTAYGTAGRRYFESNYEIRNVADRLAGILERRNGKHRYG